MNYIALVTLSIASQDQIYILLGKQNEDQSHLQLTDFRAYFSFSSKNELMAEMISWLGCDSPSINQQHVLSDDITLCHLHYTTPKRLYLDCLPENYTNETNFHGYHFVSVGSLSEKEDCHDHEIYNLLHCLMPKLLPQVKATTSMGSKFGRTVSWQNEMTALEAGSDCRQILAVVNPNLKTPEKTAISRRLIDAGKPLENTFDLSPQGGTLTTPRGGRYSLAASVGPVAFALPRDQQPNDSSLIRSLKRKLEQASPGKRPRFSETTNTDLRADLFGTFLTTDDSPKRLCETAIISRADILAVRRMKQRNNGRRRTSQQSCFGGVSADEAVKEFFQQDLTLELPHEYTHLIGYQFIGEAGQSKQNLVLATRYCNSMMMLIEDVVSILALQGHEMRLKVVALINNTSKKHLEFHVATRIVYEIKIDNDAQVTFEFNPKNIICPPSGLQSYVWHCVLAAMENKLQLKYPILSEHIPGHEADRPSEETNAGIVP